MTIRERISLDLDWKFTLADADLLKPFVTSKWGAGVWTTAGHWRQGAVALAFDDSGWRDVDVPHDFVVERQFLPADGLPEVPAQLTTMMGGSKLRGVGWYRKWFAIPAADLGRRILIHFDGVYRNSRVWLNEFYVGHHLSGYTSFWFDVTDFVNYGGDNLLVVRADATEGEGWWYEGGGIYRHVWLEKVAPVHVVPWGTFVAPRVDFGGAQPRARLDIRTRLANRSGDPVACVVRSTVWDPDGQPVGETESAVLLPLWGELEMDQALELEGPRLWSLERPELYTCTSTIVRDGRVVDEIETRFGIRTVRFDAERGFLLNEQPVKLKGVCCHQDHAGVGIAVPDALHEFRIRRLKAMGCNAYRSAHHPATPALLDICDRLGMLVIDENRLLSSSSEDLGQLESMVRRDRNHPSVILWSLGNEEVHIQFTPKSALIGRSMRNLVRALDPTRPVTLAICFWNGIVEWTPTATAGYAPLEPLPPVAAELDVMGFNYSPEYWERFHALRPEQPIVVTEATSGQRTRGCYETDPARCHIALDATQAQPANELQWAKVAEHPYLSGIFIWTGFDYRGEPLPSDWPAISSHFGVMDTCGFPKDHFYYYQAWWQPEQPGTPLELARARRTAPDGDLL
jgi:beta-galactosidase